MESARPIYKRVLLKLSGEAISSGKNGILNFEYIKEIAEVSKELSGNSAQQAKEMEQAEVGVNQISEVVQNNSAAAEETSATSEELSAQAMSMNHLIENFILKK